MPKKQHVSKISGSDALTLEQLLEEDPATEKDKEKFKEEQEASQATQ